MSWRNTLVVCGTLLAALVISTQSFALGSQYHPSLGLPWARPWPLLALYPPWAILRWWGWWHQHIPLRFLVPGGLGLLVLVMGLMQLRWTAGVVAQEAHWATWWELWRAKCFGRTGVVLGRLGSRTLRYRGEGHLFMVGGPGTGKSATLQRTLLEYPFSMFLVDPSDTLFAYEHPPCSGQRYDFAAYRRTLGPVLRYAPTCADTDRYNPFALLDTEDVPQMVRRAGLTAKLFLEPDGHRPTSDAGAHYTDHAYTLLRAEMLLGQETGLATTGSQLLEMHVTTKWQAMLINMRASAMRAVALAGEEMVHWKPTLVAGVHVTVSRALEMFTDDLVAAMTDASTLPMSSLRDGTSPCTVYLHVPFEDLPRLRPLLRVIIHQHILFNVSKLRWRFPLQFVIEEYPSIGGLDIVSDGLNFTRKYQLSFVIITPSMQEIFAIHGRHHNFLESTKMQLFFGVSDPSVAEDVSQRIGTHMVPENGRAVERRLLSQTGVQQLDPGQVILITGKHARILRQARFYDSRTLVRRATR